MDVRVLWEETYKAPSLGNPLFEDVPLVTHQVHLIARHLHQGGGVTASQEGKISLTDKPEARPEMSPDGKNWPVYTGDTEMDRFERRVAVGINAWEDGQPEPEAEWPKKPN